jgi:hypothetical protein
VTMSVFAARREGANVYLLPQSQWPQARPFYGIMSLRARPDLADQVTIVYARPMAQRNDDRAVATVDDRGPARGPSRARR